jgi:superfamily II DNA helicase RecQ
MDETQTIRELKENNSFPKKRIQYCLNFDNHSIRILQELIDHNSPKYSGINWSLINTLGADYHSLTLSIFLTHPQKEFNAFSIYRLIKDSLPNIASQLPYTATIRVTKERVKQTLEELEKLSNINIWNGATILSHTLLSSELKSLSRKAGEITARISEMENLLSGNVQTPPIQLSEFNEKLQKQLIAWRRETYRAEKIAAYRVLTNATIKSIAEMKPLTHDELLKIKGIGQLKCDMYGDEILEIVKLHI